MRKSILGLICAFLVVGVANMGHAFLFGGGGGGGHKKNSAGQTTADLGSLFNFDFHEFGVNPKTGEPGSNNTVSNPFRDYLKLPDLGANAFASNHDDAGPNFL